MSFGLFTHFKFLLLPLLSHVTLSPLYILQPLSTTFDNGCSETRRTASDSVMWFSDVPSTYRTICKHRSGSLLTVSALILGANVTKTGAWFMCVKDTTRANIAKSK